MDPATLQQTYGSIIAGYLYGDADQALRDAVEAGRRSIGLEDGLLRLVGAYQAALGRTVASAKTGRDAARLVERAGAVLVRSLAPYTAVLRHAADAAQILPPADDDTLAPSRPAANSDERLARASAIHSDAVESLAAVGARLNLVARQLDDLDTAATMGRSSIPLTDRERQILGMIAAGATNSDIAKRLVVSEHTVKSHVHNVLKKLGVKNRAQAATRYFAPQQNEGDEVQPHGFGMTESAGAPGSDVADRE